MAFDVPAVDAVLLADVLTGVERRLVASVLLLLTAAHPVGVTATSSGAGRFRCNVNLHSSIRIVTKPVAAIHRYGRRSISE